MWNRWRSTRHRYFNPRPREGGRRPLVLREISIDEFQSTPPRGGATAMEDNKPADTWISIHAPARGGDAAYQLKIDALEISIHAPARGGDTSAADRSFTSRNFNPRPREGGRPPWRSSGPSRAHNFNPRPREGGDIDKPPCYVWVRISIHAPARGATSGNKSFLWVYLYFNPRPREGGDPPRLHAQGSGQVFQSTPPRGGRLTGSATVTYGGLISIHAPARGATTWRGQKSRSCWISIHAPARGATFRQPLHGHYAGISIHAPARGATVETYVLISRKLLFQSTPPRGGRPLHGRLLHHSAVISIHAPARGATSPHLG